MHKIIAQRAKVCAGHLVTTTGWEDGHAQRITVVCVVTLAAVIHAQGDAMMEGLQS
jgi:hypothetical protein